jgi:DNA repair photolyase
MNDKEYNELLKWPVVKMSDEIFKYIIDRWYAGKEVILPRKIEYPFGTYEWCDETFNSHEGCKNSCLNCYARNLAHQKKYSYWENYDRAEIVRKTKWVKNWKRKPNGFWFMYPSMHDTFEETAGDAIKVIGNMLKANGNVLWVTKPRYKVVKRVLDKFSKYKISAFEEPRNYLQGQPHIKIRMSISTNNDDYIAYYEENAPKYDEREKALILAYEMGADVGASCEPYFPVKLKDGEDPIEKFIEWVRYLLQYITDELWIGKMNYIPTDNGKAKQGIYELRGEPLTEEQIAKFRELEKFYKFENILRIVDALHDEPNIRFKESIKKLMINHIRQHPVRVAVAA